VELGDNHLALFLGVIALAFAFAGILILVITPDLPSTPTGDALASPSREDSSEQSPISSSLDVISGSDVNDDRLSFGVPGSALSSNTNASPEPSPATSPRKISLCDLEGTYSTTRNGITLTLRIWDADDDTAYGSMYSTNFGTRRCIVAALGGNLLTLIFLDSSELRLRYTGTSSMTFVDSGVVLHRQ